MIDYINRDIEVRDWVKRIRVVDRVDLSHHLVEV